MKPTVVRASATLSEHLYFFTRVREKLRLETGNPMNHWRCPKCSVAMTSVRKGAVIIETCPKCCGIFLDDGELEAIKR